MELLWEYALPTDENSKDYQYESPVFVNGGNVFFICRGSKNGKKYSLYVIDKISGALKNEFELYGDSVLPNECFFETYGDKTIIYTGNLWLYSNEDGFSEMWNGLFECKDDSLFDGLNAYEIVEALANRKKYRITSHLVYKNFFICSNKDNLYCINIEKNDLEWEIAMPNSQPYSCGSIFLFEDKISCYGNDKLLFIDIFNGKILDEIKIPRISKLFCPVRMGDGTLLIGFTNWSNAGILRYNEKSKKVIWKSKRAFEGPLLRTEIFVQGGFVYWLKNDTEIICINTENGEEVYRAPTSPWRYTEPLFLHGRIMFGTSGRDGFLTNIDSESGKEMWSLPFKNGCAFFDMYENTVILGDFNKKLYQVDFESGNILQESRVGGEVVGDVTVEENDVYTVVWGNESEPIKLIKVKIV